MMLQSKTMMQSKTVIERSRCGALALSGTLISSHIVTESAYVRSAKPTRRHRSGVKKFTSIKVREDRLHEAPGRERGADPVC
jgi:hypothetical protein